MHLPLIIFVSLFVVSCIIIIFLFNKNRALRHTVFQNKNPSEETKKLEEKNRKLFAMSETVYKEKKKVDETLEKIKTEKEKLEEEKKKFQEKNKKLWQQSVAIHKEKERIDILKQEVERKHKDVMDSISYAQRIQTAILPSDVYLQENFPEHFVLYKPKDIVAGDYYWAYKSKEGEFFLTAADCTGHGVPGAFMSMIGCALLNEIVIEKNITEVNVILDEMRKGIINALKQHGLAGGSKDGMDMTLIKWKMACSEQFGNAHRNSSPTVEGKWEMEFAGANNPLWLVKKGALSELEADRQPVGYHAVMTPFKKQTCTLEKGDCLYLFSDGYADQFGGPKGKKFRYKQLEELIVSIHQKPMDEQKKILNNTIDDWMKDEDQIDDICVVGLRV